MRFTKINFIETVVHNLNNFAMYSFFEITKYTANEKSEGRYREKAFNDWLKYILETWRKRQTNLNILKILMYNTHCNWKRASCGVKNTNISLKKDKFLFSSGIADRLKDGCLT